jgi:hypothetical protein
MILLVVVLEKLVISSASGVRHVSEQPVLEGQKWGRKFFLGEGQLPAVHQTQQMFAV